MGVRQFQESDIEALTQLFKAHFKTHNRFSQSDADIAAYIRTQSQEHSLLVLDEDGITGATFLVNVGQNADGSHKLWKFRHFAFVSDEAGKALLERAEELAKNASTTAKIELTISETEPGIEFYKKNGYSQEATLRNHYRWDETCFILSKSFS